MTETATIRSGPGAQGAAIEPPRTIGVLVCSYKRPDNLALCLEGLVAQERRPDDVIIVCRHSDTPTRDFLANRPPDGLKLRVLTVTEPGTVRALNIGLDNCRTDIVAIADDDTVAQPQWLRVLFDHFAADPAIGGVGGRDRCHDGTAFDDRREAVVGRLQWFGRSIGNHHIGFGQPRPVQHLKGANMAYRARAIAGIRFDSRLRGSGAQPFEDFTFSMRVARDGWTLLYDPDALVYHYAGRRDEPRHYGAMLPVRDADGFRDCAFNFVVAVWDELPPPRRLAFMLWSVLVGTGVNPGLVQALRYTRKLGLGSWHRFWLTQQGKLAAYRVMLRGAPGADQGGAAEPGTAQSSVAQSSVAQSSVAGGG